MSTEPSTLQRISLREAEITPGFTVRRALPTRERRMVGPWCFLDHIGPVELAGDQAGMHVDEHPHTCLQTFTWMIEGEVMHRDSLRSEQIIRPGQVNLMTAGHGVTHTEDSLDSSRRLHGVQLWIALPEAQADMPPAFHHYPELPRWQEEGCELTLLAGQHARRQAPTLMHSPAIALDIHAPAGAELKLPLSAEFEHGVLPLTGQVRIDSKAQAFTPKEFAWLAPGPQIVTLHLAADTRLILVGGTPWQQNVIMWWNFVGHSREAVKQAQTDWEAGSPRFGTVPHARRRLAAPKLPW